MGKEKGKNLTKQIFKFEVKRQNTRNTRKIFFLIFYIVSQCTYYTFILFLYFIIQIIFTYLSTLMAIIIYNPAAVNCYIFSAKLAKIGVYIYCM